LKVGEGDKVQGLMMFTGIYELIALIAFIVGLVAWIFMMLEPFWGPYCKRLWDKWLKEDARMQREAEEKRRKEKAEEDALGSKNTNTD
jgi:hypothetical protein